MSKDSDIQVIGSALYLLPVDTRVPVKFGAEVLSRVVCARVCLTVTNRRGDTAVGWGETPLSAQWAWPGDLSYEDRNEAMIAFCRVLADAWTAYGQSGHPIEIGHAFQRVELQQLLAGFNADSSLARSPMPWLAALVCCSAFDIALHDAYGSLLNRPVYTTYGREFMNEDLGKYLDPASGAPVSFKGLYPSDYLEKASLQMPVWHLVAGLDPIMPEDLSGDEPADGVPVLLADWIERDGLKCLKIKLRGNDIEWDYQRIIRVGGVAMERGVLWLSVDFNCMVTDPLYVTEVLDRLVIEQPRIYGMILYVEQPFPYELNSHPIDVHAVSSRKPLFMDESAHDWSVVRRGRGLGWTGVALKTCKTQTGAVLSMCWAKAHGMTLMVQDLANPMLAMIPHALLAAHAGTIMGVESNASQFYPVASESEAAVHPGLYRRRHGRIKLDSLGAQGFGYRIEDITRVMPAPSAVYGDVAGLTGAGARV